jgi:hypothetical protein
VNRDRGGGGPGSGSDKGGGRGENELNVGAKSCGEFKEMVVLGVGGEPDWGFVGSGWVVRIPSVPKREYSGPVVLESGSRRGTDASTERVRLWTSLRLATVVEVTSLEDEPSTSLFLRLRARRRAKRTITKMRTMVKRRPQTAATMMMVSLLLVDVWVEDGAALG